MQTTIDLDEDVLQAAQALADRRGQNLGAVISDLVRQTLEPTRGYEIAPDGFPVLKRLPGAKPVTPEQFEAALEATL